jgi:hypothetical protein
VARSKAALPASLQDEECPVLAHLRHYLEGSNPSIARRSEGARNFSG